MQKLLIGQRLGSLATLVAAATLLAGCASISVPFASLSDAPSDPIVTNSVAQQSVGEPTQTDLPAMVSAVAPTGQPLLAPPSTPQDQSTLSTNPADDLVASIPDPASARISLSQADLNAMGEQLTAALRADEGVGTFDWAHAQTGRSGLMTPFRPVGNDSNSACRMVSVEITDGPRDVILLADACLQEGRWVFLSPRAGEAL